MGDYLNLFARAFSTEGLEKPFSTFRRSKEVFLVYFDVFELGRSRRHNIGMGPDGDRKEMGHGR